MPEDDPTYISEEENEAIFKILDRTPQIDRAEALRRVVGNERARRLLRAEDAAKRQDSSASRPVKPYRARFQDSTDESVRALKEGTESQSEMSDEEVAAGLEVRDFVRRVIDETGSFGGLQAYLQSHPEQVDEARRLGLLG